MISMEQAGYGGVRVTEFRCPGARLNRCGTETHDNQVASLARADTGFSMWRMDTHGTQVAACERTGEGCSIWRIEVPIRDTDFNTAPGMGLPIPVAWNPAKMSFS
jgi:hypothetical protein